MQTPTASHNQELSADFISKIQQIRKIYDKCWEDEESYQGRFAGGYHYDKNAIKKAAKDICDVLSVEAPVHSNPGYNLIEFLTSIFKIDEKTCSKEDLKNKIMDNILPLFSQLRPYKHHNQYAIHDLFIQNKQLMESKKEIDLSLLEQIDLDSRLRVGLKLLSNMNMIHVSTFDICLEELNVNIAKTQEEKRKAEQRAKQLEVQEREERERKEEENMKIANKKKEEEEKRVQKMEQITTPLLSNWKNMTSQEQQNIYEIIKDINRACKKALASNQHAAFFIVQTRFEKLDGINPDTIRKYKLDPLLNQTIEDLQEVTGALLSHLALMIEAKEKLNLQTLSVQINSLEKQFSDQDPARNKVTLAILNSIKLVNGKYIMPSIEDIKSKLDKDDKYLVPDDVKMLFKERGLYALFTFIEDNNINFIEPFILKCKRFLEPAMSNSAPVNIGNLTKSSNTEPETSYTYKPAFPYRSFSTEMRHFKDYYTKEITKDPKYEAKYEQIFTEIERLKFEIPKNDEKFMNRLTELHIDKLLTIPGGALPERTIKEMKREVNEIHAKCNIGNRYH